MHRSILLMQGFCIFICIKLLIVSNKLVKYARNVTVHVIKKSFEMIDLRLMKRRFLYSFIIYN